MYLKKINKLITQIRSSKFVQNSSILVMSSVVAQGINFLLLPILTRLISPQEYGYFAFVLSTASITSIFAFGRLEYILPQLKKNITRMRLIHSGLLFFISVSILFTILLYFLSPQILLWGQISISNNFLQDYLMIFVSMSLLNLMNQFQISLGGFKTLAMNRILQVVVNIFMLWIFVSIFKYSGQLALVKAAFLSNSVAIILSFIDVVYYKNEKWFSASFPRVKFIFQKHKKMILLNSPHALLDSIQVNFTQQLFSRYFSLQSLGEFSFSNRIIRVPGSIIGSAVAQVMYNHIGTWKNLKQIKDYTMKVVLILLGLSILIGTIGFIIIKLFFVTLFGEQWAGAADVALALLPWTLVNLVSSPISQIPLIISRQGSALIYGIIYNVGLILSVLIAQQMGFSFVESIWTLSLTGAFFNALYVIWVFYILSDVE